MRHVAIDAVDSDDLDERGVHRRDLADVLGTTDVAVNHYRVDPGSRLPGGLHAHADQEELFVVLSGEATFETYRPGGETPPAGTDETLPEAPSSDEVTVHTGEAVRFPPGEFQSGRNDADETLVVLALGAPRETEDVRLPLSCPDCGRADVRLATGDGARFVCPDCGDERTPADCPDCGGDALVVSLGADGDPVVVCRLCGAEYRTPPIER